MVNKINLPFILGVTSYVALWGTKTKQIWIIHRKYNQKTVEKIYIVKKKKKICERKGDSTILETLLGLMRKKRKEKEEKYLFYETSQ